MNKKVIIVGGSGFIGSKLTEKLLEIGYTVIVVDLVPTRISHNNLSFVKKDFSNGESDPGLFEGALGVINLAGVSIGKRWSEEYKKLIYSSRVKTTRTIINSISSTNTKPEVLVNASAVGYYGNGGNQLLSEYERSGHDFLARVCVDWEAEADKAENYGVRIVKIRTAHVLGPGGILQTLEPIFKIGLGGFFGNGKQYMPWIHHEDVVSVYIHALESSMSGAFNVGAGETPTQKELFRSFAKAIHAPMQFLFPIPLFVARIILGEFATSLGEGQNTDSSKLLQTGYTHQYTDINRALESLYSKTQ